MEPRIQYAKTEDGVNIAYWTLGEGMPLVVMPRLPYSHIQVEWQIPEWRAWYERLADKRMLVRYDDRGTGISDREATDFSLDALVMDLQAVVDALELDQFALLGISTSGPAAIAYAAQQPERVSHLLLWCAAARASHYFQGPRVQSLLRTLEDDWELFTESAAQYGYGWSEAASAHRWAAYMRESVTQKAASEAYGAFARVDVTDLLGKIRSPTLVVHLRQLDYPGVQAARAIVSGIRGASLALVEGDMPLAFLGDMRTAADPIDEFLSGAKGASAASKEAEPGGFATILFTDMESSTALTQQLGDAGAQEVRRAHNKIVRTALNANGGNEIKHTGDGIMASFATASSALDCAIAIQRGVATHKEAHPDSPLGVYVGLNAGEPIAEEDDLFGTSVDLAARICDHAQAGQIVAADVVRQLTAGKQFLFADLGETELRGFEDPIKLWELRWQAEGSPKETAG